MHDQPIASSLIHDMTRAQALMDKTRKGGPTYRAAQKLRDQAFSLYVFG